MISCILLLVTVASYAEGNCYADVYFIVDNSQDNTPAQFQKEINFISDLTSKRTIGPNNVRFGVLLTSRRARLVFGLKRFTNHKALALRLSKTKALKPAKNFWMGRGLRAIHRRNLFGPAWGGRPDAENVIVLVSDKKNPLPKTTVWWAKFLKKRGYTIVTLSIASPLKVMNKIASSPQDVFHVNSYNNIDNVQTGILNRICRFSKRPIIVPPNPSRPVRPDNNNNNNNQNNNNNNVNNNQYIIVDNKPTIIVNNTPIFVTKNNITFNAGNTIIDSVDDSDPNYGDLNDDYEGDYNYDEVTDDETLDDYTEEPVIATTIATPIPTTPKPCTKKSQADIIFLLDASSSIRSDNWKAQTSFAADITQAFTIGKDDVQFSTVIFNSVVTVIHYLNTYSDKSSLYKAISSIEYPGAQGTLTNKGLRKIREDELFSAKYGGRSSKRIVIVMTDGASSDKSKAIEEADLLKKEGVIIFSVGIGSDISLDELRGIASDPEKNVFLAGGFDLLNVIKNDIVSQTCTRV